MIDIAPLLACIAAIMLPTMLITSLFASSLLEYIEFIYSEIHLIR